MNCCCITIPDWFPLLPIAYFGAFAGLLWTGDRLMEWWERRR
jgi:hypothetical protein